jgi:hypothetical protein
MPSKRAAGGGTLVRLVSRLAFSLVATAVPAPYLSSCRQSQHFAAPSVIAHRLLYGSLTHATLLPREAVRVAMTNHSSSLPRPIPEIPRPNHADHAYHYATYHSPLTGGSLNKSENNAPSPAPSTGSPTKAFRVPLDPEPESSYLLLTCAFLTFSSCHVLLHCVCCFVQLSAPFC